VSDDFGNPEFWIALAVGILCLALFFYWLRTGARRGA
jgi:hypothetical protein